MIKLQLMSTEDVCQIAEIEKQCFNDPWSENSIVSELQNPLSCWLVAKDGDTVAGYIGSQTVLDGSDMMNIAVRPEYRRQGIAECLIKELTAKVKEKGVVSLSLEVRVSNTAAISLYSKLDFHQAGRRPNYYRNPKEDAFIMRMEW